MKGFDVGNRSQLFVDQVLVRSSQNVAFSPVPARKHPLNPLIRAERPWEGWRLNMGGTALRDERGDTYKMWYYAEAPEFFHHAGHGETLPTCYATSIDGIHWEKPPVGRAVARIADHNVVADDLIQLTVLADGADPDPNRRYKGTCFTYNPRGYYTVVSPDGFTWTRLGDRPIAPDADSITCYFDRDRRLFVAFPKIHQPVRGQRRRCFSIITSPDFVSWSEPRSAFVPDLRDDAGSLARIEEVRPILDQPDDPELMRTEFYGVGAYPAESCTLAFLWMLTINNNARYGNHEGPGELQLAVSRNLEDWERPFRSPIVPRGQLGEWDCGWFDCASQALTVGDEIWLYYGGGNYTHGTPCLYRAEGTGRGTDFTSSIGLAIWDYDRFVSVDGPAEGGSLTTVPLVFAGSRLELNAATRPGGAIDVEVLEPSGHILARSDSFSGDALRHPLPWEKGFEIGRLAGRPVVLRFVIRSGSLFAFAFRD